VGFSEGALCGLDQGNTVLGISDSLIQTSDLASHLLADGKACGVIAGTVDAVSGRQLLQGLSGCGVVDAQLTIGIQSGNVVVDNHIIILLDSFWGESFLPRFVPFTRNKGLWVNLSAEPAPERQKSFPSARFIGEPILKL